MEITDPAALARDLAPAGALRAAVNPGNPVLAQGTPDAPRGATVDLTGEIARRLGLPVEFLCFDAARTSYEAMAAGRADLCFLAVEPAREAEIAFTAPYAHIERVYAVPAESTPRPPEDVDREGVRIEVKQGFRLRPVPDAHPAPRHRGPGRGGGGRLPRRESGGRGRNPAAPHRARRRTARAAPGRARVHDHPAGRRDDADAAA
ncbi:transporter substrate-binding domain-containing protein [Streptomyces sp. NBRC 110028]|uniref:transporter substrate-binding domain-containing protein n=1 Tax=Streptomyces sp. NBRC 110028 TaxID=1621260 RepID=UPI001F40FD46|nr:transporter substrate-binding domain-containing protein [Streptomyces sp. NBRC 110028]